MSEPLELRFDAEGHVDPDAFPDVDPDLALDPDELVALRARLVSSPEPRLSPERWQELVERATTSEADADPSLLAPPEDDGGAPFETEPSAVEADEPATAGSPDDDTDLETWTDEPGVDDHPPAAGELPDAGWPAHDSGHLDDGAYDSDLDDGPDDDVDDG